MKYLKKYIMFKSWTLYVRNTPNLFCSLYPFFYKVKIQFELFFLQKTLCMCFEQIFSIIVLPFVVNKKFKMGKSNDTLSENLIN